MCKIFVTCSFEYFRSSLVAHLSYYVLRTLRTELCTIYFFLHNLFLRWLVNKFVDLRTRERLTHMIATWIVLLQQLSNRNTFFVQREGARHDPIVLRKRTPRQHGIAHFRLTPGNSLQASKKKIKQKMRCDWCTATCDIRNGRLELLYVSRPSQRVKHSYWLPPVFPQWKGALRHPSIRRLRTVVRS